MPGEYPGIIVAQYRNARRIISAVFQPPQPVKNDGNCLAATYITYDSTHRPTIALLNSPERLLNVSVENFQPVILNDRVG